MAKLQFVDGIFTFGELITYNQLSDELEKVTTAENSNNITANTFAYSFLSIRNKLPAYL